MKRGDHLPLALAIALVALAGGAFVFRAALPNDQHRDIDFHGIPREGWAPAAVSNGYDDVVTQVAARHFARDGWLHTGLLENRGGAPEVALWNHIFHWCVPDRTGTAQRYRVWNTVWSSATPADAVWVDAWAIDHDCLYTHYPPLPVWIFGALASAGADSILDFRLVAMAGNCLALLLLYLWLRRETSPWAALGALALLATAPAIVTWSQALYYHSLQFPLLFATLIAWRRFLAAGTRGRAALAGILYFLLGLISFDLVMLAGIAAAAQSLLDDRSPLPRAVRRLAALAAAPVLALLLPFALRLGVFGPSAVWADFSHTVVSRSVNEFGWTGLTFYWAAIEAYLLPLWLGFVGFAGIVMVRGAAGAPLRRPLVLLAALGLGGLSFAIVFPGTTSINASMMYRHLLPAVALLVALSLDAAGRAAALLRARAEVGAAVVGVATLAVVAGWTGWRNVVALRREVRWEWTHNAQHDPANQAVRFLDAIYWKEWGPLLVDGRVLMPVDGARVYDPPDPSLVFFLEEEVGARYEVWWLDPIDVREVRILTAEYSALPMRERCWLTAFDGQRFGLPTPVKTGLVEPFVSSPGEPAAPDLRWLVVPFRAHGKALRLSCDGLPEPAPLHELEVR